MITAALITLKSAVVYISVDLPCTPIEIGRGFLDREPFLHITPITFSCVLYGYLHEFLSFACVRLTPPVFPTIIKMVSLCFLQSD